MLAGSASRGGENTPVPSTIIVAVEFKGAEHFSADELQRYTNLGAGLEFDAAKAADDCAAIVRHYQEHGYPFATCTHRRQHTFYYALRCMSAVVYEINEGPKVKVQRVEFVGNTFVSDAVLADQLQCHKRGSSRANFAQVHEDVIRLTEYYRSFGYYDVEVSYELQWNLDGGAATMLFRIHEGERYK
jgi:outer membrane protein assembly factor BamA